MSVLKYIILICIYSPFYLINSFKSCLRTNKLLQNRILEAKSSKPESILESHFLKEVPLKNYRNIGIMAHIDAGKTTTTERILYFTGLSYRIGEVHDGEAIMDYMEQERERGITIQSAATTCYWSGSYDPTENHRINIIDTPGHVDFTAEVERSLRVLDGAIAVFDGVAGVEPQSETVWRQADKYNIPRIAYINKMDRQGADFFKCVEEISRMLGGKPAIFYIPYYNNMEFQGVINILKNVYITFDESSKGTKYKLNPVPEKMVEQVQELRNKLFEQAAQANNELLEKYMNDQMTEADVQLGIRIQTIDSQLVPICCGSSLKNKNIQGLLDMIIQYLPDPTESGYERKSATVIETAEGEEEYSNTDYQNLPPLDFKHPIALVFKNSSDPHLGNQSFIRVYRGEIRVGDVIYNTRTKKSEKVQKLQFIHSNKRVDVKSVKMGDIASLSGVKTVLTGDTLCSPKKPITLERIKFPVPVISKSVLAKNKAEHDKLLSTLRKFVDDDPCLKMHIDKETDETVISGMGELHLEIVVDRIRREHNLEMITGAPQVAYRETFTSSVKVEGKYIKQTGGHGQYGHVVLELLPTERGAGVVFTNNITCGAIPKVYIPSVEVGVRDQLSTGLKAGYPVTDVQVILWDGTYHDVDSSDFAFQMAAANAIREAGKLASMDILEPIMKVFITCPTQYFGVVMEDFMKRRGKIKGTTHGSGDVRQIVGEAPLGELTSYATCLRSVSQGRGNYNMELLKYDFLPAYNAEQLTKGGQKNK